MNAWRSRLAHDAHIARRRPSPAIGGGERIFSCWEASGSSRSPSAVACSGVRRKQTHERNRRASTRLAHRHLSRAALELGCGQAPLIGIRSEFDHLCDNLLVVRIHAQPSLKSGLILDNPCPRIYRKDNDMTSRVVEIELC